MTTILVTAIACFGGGAIMSLFVLRRWFAYEREQMLRKTAEKAAESALRVEAETRKTHHEIEKYNKHTSVLDGNKLLSRKDTNGKK